MLSPVILSLESHRINPRPFHLSGRWEQERARYQLDDYALLALARDAAMLTRMRDLYKNGAWFHPLLLSVKSPLNAGDKMVDDLRMDAMQFIADKRAKHEDMPCVLFLLILLGAEKPGASFFYSCLCAGRRPVLCVKGDRRDA